jgi:excinuclease ABC subunit A
MLLTVLHRLRDHGNTVVVIEHNLDVIKTADWIVDLGPEGGAGGGRILVAGTPEEVAGTPESHTGRFLLPHLKAAAPVQEKPAAKRAKNTLKHIASADKHRPMPRKKKAP